MRQTGKRLKPILRKVGCDLLFYDYLDSYEERFQRIVEHAKASIPMLAGIHEVPSGVLEDTNWEELGYGDLTQVFFSLSDTFADYVKADAQGNLRGSATFFVDESGAERAVILIEKPSTGGKDTRDIQYALKVAGLVHEIGHVEDAVRRGNICIEEKSFDVVAAEVFAHVYALNELARLGMRHSYLMLYEALKRLAASDGYAGDIGKGVMSSHEKVAIPNWQDFMKDVEEHAA